MTHPDAIEWLDRWLREGKPGTRFAKIETVHLGSASGRGFEVRLSEGERWALASGEKPLALLLWSALTYMETGQFSDAK